MKKYKLKKDTGFVVGKFYPFHAGHALLVETALATAPNITVIVLRRPGETIPVEQRAAWIKENYPQVEIMIKDNTLPDDDCALWAKTTLEWFGYIPEYVFSSEDWGDPYAHYMGNTHIPVDYERKKVPISGTKVRANPKKYLHFLKPNVRRYFEAKIAQEEKPQQ